MALLRRLEKVRRWLRWRVGARGSLPIWWHIGRPNFGDDINPSFFGKVHGGAVRFAARRERPHILGVGSILEHATDASVVCGSGFLQPPRGPSSAAEFVAVRGALSASACRAPEHVLLGDPLVLIDAYVARGPIRHRFGFVPHVTSVARWRACSRRQHHIIDPAWDPWRTILEIASCETIFSQSLHGLIVADALGIPNVWIAPSADMRGGRFKFDDYFSTLDEQKPTIPESRDLFVAPQRHAAGVGRYRFCKDQLRQSLAAACSRVASRPGSTH